MNLDELTSYALEKYNIPEQHKWSDFPGFSVLVDPSTDMWVALLMRQWDSDSGKEIQRCDLKCGRLVLSQDPKPFLSLPFRMKGTNWVGVRFDEDTQAETVFTLLDLALSRSENRGYTILLRNAPIPQQEVYAYTSIPSSDSFEIERDELPKKIREMMHLYEYRGNSFAQKSYNFYKQGKFMEDYDDNAPWSGSFKRYFTTYHDLTVKQLRGYFTWRTKVRKGIYEPITTSLAYMYIYELLNGIGVHSPNEALEKMEEFQKEYIDSSIGDKNMGHNLSRWMFEFSILHDMPLEKTKKHVSDKILKEDRALSFLKKPEKVEDDILFDALCVFARKNFLSSPVFKKERQFSKHFFCTLWRYVQNNYRQEGKKLFEVCFGRSRYFSWHPLSNALVYQATDSKDMEYILDESRSYRCKNGKWQEKRYLIVDKARFQSLLHQGDVQLRRYLKTGYYLKSDPREAWAIPYVEVLLAQEKAKIEKKMIHVDLSGLSKIRKEALWTQDHLLTQEEMEQEPLKIEIVDKEPDSSIEGLDSIEIQILTMLVKGESVDTIIKDNHKMPSIIADTINEALFDEIGDNVIEWDGNGLEIVQDYKEDLLIWLGGEEHG